VKISYDQKADALYIKLQDGSPLKTRRVEEGLLVDLDEAGRLVGLEIIGMKGRIPIPELGKIIIEMPVKGTGPVPA
jgi:uncharacterized protein YuzE